MFRQELYPTVKTIVLVNKPDDPRIGARRHEDDVSCKLPLSALTDRVSDDAE